MKREDVVIKLLEEDDKEQFILDNQEAFKYGAMEEFGLRDDHFEKDGEIISRATIEKSICNGTAYRIWVGDRKVGGAVVKVKGEKGDLDLLFVKPSEHTRGIGYAAWSAIEKMYPEVRLWETCTPYFETRNIHFYVNRCGFHIVEFFNQFHKDPNDSEIGNDNSEYDNGMDGMFRFEKRIR